MKKIFLVEDHDRALRIWQRMGFRNMDLVHVDAHMDYFVPAAQPLESILRDATSVKDLKFKLEYSLAFARYQKDLNAQTDIGNYIHWAMEEGIVGNFTWVVPGDRGGFSKNAAQIRDIVRRAVRAKMGGAGLSFSAACPGMMTFEIAGRSFRICVLETLPVFLSPVLLDIDTDFLMIPSVSEANYTRQVGRRKPWIMPSELVRILREKIVIPKAITIAYSTTGGWTPMKYRYLGDDLAYQFAPGKFENIFLKSLNAAHNFSLFQETGKQAFYSKAARLNPAYRAPDNNYGPIYLDKRQNARAKKEFQKILKADRCHAGALYGMGILAHRQKDYQSALAWLRRAWRTTGRCRIFYSLKKRILYSLALTEFYGKDFKGAYAKLKAYSRMSPLDPDPRYLLGCLAQRNKQFHKAVVYYRQALQLGYPDEKPVTELIKIVRNLPQRGDIIKYIRRKCADFRRNLRALERREKKKKAPELARMREVLYKMEKNIKKITREVCE